MKAIASLYAPRALLDIAGLERVYALLVLQVTALIAARDFSGVLKVSHQIRRAAKALVKGRARAEAAERKLSMLLNPAWRARVICDLGGAKALAMWERAMKRAAVRDMTRKTLKVFYPEALRAAPDTFVPPQTIQAQKAEAEQEAHIRAHIRACAKASAHPNITRDAFRVDQDGLFRLPPVPRFAGLTARKTLPAREYTYDARPLSKLTGHYAPVPVWPAEFHAAQSAQEKSEAARVFAYGPTPGRRRKPKRRRAGGPQILKPLPQTSRRRIWAPP